MLAPNSNWSWIWRLKVPLICVLLVWLVVHDSLPTNACRFRRAMASSATCALCNEGDETVLHCLRDCRHAKGRSLESARLTTLPIQCFLSRTSVCGFVMFWVILIPLRFLRFGGFGGLGVLFAWRICCCILLW